VDENADYNGGSPSHESPFYFTEVRLPAGRFDTPRKQHVIRDFTKIILLAENKPFVPEEANRVWVRTIDLKRDGRGIGGHTDWLRAYDKCPRCAWYGTEGTTVINISDCSGEPGLQLQPQKWSRNTTHAGEGPMVQGATRERQQRRYAPS
jgi:hypothetical protein